MRECLRDSEVLRNVIYEAQRLWPPLMGGFRIAQRVGSFSVMLCVHTFGIAQRVSPFTVMSYVCVYICVVSMCVSTDFNLCDIFSFASSYHQ